MFNYSNLCYCGNTFPSTMTQDQCTGTTLGGDNTIQTHSTYMSVYEVKSKMMKF